ncbi:MAG: SoxR reducing system RseC family protein [Ignavibacteriales bacterium]
MNEWGKIIALKGKTAILSMQKSDECDRCRKCRPGRGEKEMVGEAKNKINAKVGDTVEVNDHSIDLFERIVITTGIPIIDGIIGLYIGYMIADLFKIDSAKPFSMIITALLFIIASYVFSKKQLIEINKLKTKKLVVSSIIHKEG